MKRDSNSGLAHLTILVLVIESNWAVGNGRTIRVVEKNASGAEFCWLTENFKVVEECHPCTDFEIASKSNRICSGTHFKESVICEKSGKVFRSCERVTWLEEKKFWQFEGFMFMVGCFSTVTVYLRQRVLDYRTLKRIHRQIANSV
ncbi:protein JTB-like [Macrosteles quadrilineatus]|uniref:protein JTB-like n=1 Tax=Macrosteles quadrilineatus TaxID=74068 RepID=UPI0023E0DAE2|nr:protein JTB-like [Macrosteles quadrilineatus]